MFSVILTSDAIVPVPASAEMLSVEALALADLCLRRRLRGQPG